MIHTPSDSLKVKAAVTSQALASGATNGAIIDAAGFERALLVVNVGDMTGTSPTLDVKVQDGAASNLSDAADVSGAALTQIDGTHDQAVYLLDLNLAKRKRYIRAVFTVGGTSTPTAPAGASWILVDGRHLPVTQDNTVIQAL